MADAIGRRVLRWHTRRRLHKSEGPQHAIDHVSILLFACHRWMCNDMEEHLVS